MTVLIFGGVGGIGEALARRLRSQGQSVVLTARIAERAEALADEIGAAGIAVDVNDPPSIVRAVEAAASINGALTGLAYCVGSIPLKPLAMTTAGDMQQAYHLNVVGAMLAVQAAAPALRAGSGSVVLFSSVAARAGFANHTAIAAAKAGVEGLTVALAAELAPSVRVNAIAPSLTVTPLSKALTQNPKMADAIAAMHPIPRLGTADEVAGLAQFLLSPDAGWITGQIMAVDGGRSALRTAKS